MCARRTDEPTPALDQSGLVDSSSCQCPILAKGTRAPPSANRQSPIQEGALESAHGLTSRYHRGVGWHDDLVVLGGTEQVGRHNEQVQFL